MFRKIINFKKAVTSKKLSTKSWRGKNPLFRIYLKMLFTLTSWLACRLANDCFIPLPTCQMMDSGGCALKGHSPHSSSYQTVLPTEFKSVNKFLITHKASYEKLLTRKRRHQKLLWTGALLRRAFDSLLDCESPPGQDNTTSPAECSNHLLSWTSKRTGFRSRNLTLELVPGPSPTFKNTHKSVCKSKSARNK